MGKSGAAAKEARTEWPKKRLARLTSFRKKARGKLQDANGAESLRRADDRICPNRETGKPGAWRKGKPGISMAAAKMTWLAD